MLEVCLQYYAKGGFRARVYLQETCRDVHKIPGTNKLVWECCFSYSELISIVFVSLPSKARVDSVNRYCFCQISYLVIFIQYLIVFLFTIYNFTQNQIQQLIERVATILSLLKGKGHLNKWYAVTSGNERNSPMLHTLATSVTSAAS